jgi:FtsH-binding integral membrane protein
MLPSISHDYNLPLLATPFALLLSAQNIRDGRWMKILSIGLIAAASFAYAVTLFPSNARPPALENSFPSLFILLTVVTVLSFMQKHFNREGNKGTQR